MGRVCILLSLTAGLLLAACGAGLFEVALVVPAGGTIDPATVFRLHFDDPLDVASALSPGALVCEGPDGPVDVIVRVDPGGKALSVVPRHPLAPATKYRLKARETIRARDGRALSAPLVVGYLTSPSAPSFADAGPTRVARFFHTATPLDSGRVLIAGGIREDTGGGAPPVPLSSATLLDPSSGSLHGTSMRVRRFRHTATKLPDGSVLIAGGAVGPDTERYDPKTGRFTTGPSMASARLGHTATLLPSGKLLLAGGMRLVIEGMGYHYETLATSELIDAETPGAAVGEMGLPRVGASATLLPSGKVVLAGGSADPAVEIFDPATGSFHPAGRLVLAREDHRAVLLASGKLLLVGGSDPSGKSLASCELYDPVTGHAHLVGSMAFAREDHTLTVLPSGKILITGGEDNAAGPGGADVVLASAERYDPSTGSWTVVGALSTPRDDHTATLLPGGAVLLWGGEGPRGRGIPSREWHTPAD